MPKYFLINNNVVGEGFRDQEVFQFYDTVYVSENLVAGENQSNQVGVGEEGTGNFIVTDSLAPCQAVIAKLTTGQFSIYHCELGWKVCKEFLYFIEEIKDKIEYIYVFQKNHPPSNLKKAPYLAIELTKHLGVEVKRLHVDNHTFIIGDSANNRVILGKNIIYYQPGIYIMANKINTNDYIQYKDSYIFYKEAIPSLIYINELGQVEHKSMDEDDIEKFNKIINELQHHDESRPIQEIVNDDDILNSLRELATYDKNYCEISKYVRFQNEEQDLRKEISIYDAISINESIHKIDQDNQEVQINDRGDRYYPACEFTIPQNLLQNFNEFKNKENTFTSKI